MAQDWDDLADRTSAMPWVRPGWTAAWWKAFGHGKLEILVVRRGRRLAAVLPLQQRLGELRSTTNPHTPGFCLLAEDDAARRQLARALVQRGSRRIALGYLAPTGAGLQEAGEVAQPAGYLVATWPLLRSPYVATNGSWAGYERQLATRKLRELRRRRRQLERQGRLWLDVENGTERLDELLAEGWKVEAAGWKGTRGTAIASRADTRAFYRDVARWAAARGMLRLAFLRLDGHPLAFDYSLEDNQTHYLVKTGYDPAYRAFGPGMLLRYEMLSRAFASDVATYEFLGRNDPWKSEWTSDVRELMVLQAFTRSLPGMVDWAAWTYGRPMARRLRSTLAR